MLTREKATYVDIYLEIEISRNYESSFGENESQPVAKCVITRELVLEVHGCLS